MNMMPPLFLVVVVSAVLIGILLHHRTRLRSHIEQVHRNHASEVERLTGEISRLSAANAKAASLLVRYRPITDIEGYAENVRKDHENEKLRISKERTDLESSIASLRGQYQEKRRIYDGLLHEVAIFEEKLAFAEMGVYSPHFDYSDSEQYKANIESVRLKQKELVAKGSAATCQINWTVDGSESKGKKMTERGIKLTLRAFNGECDAAVSNIRWNNAQAMGKRIESAFEKINKLNDSSKISISKEYLSLRLKELHLTHEYREKLKAEKEERAEMARAAKEEQKLQRDLERAQDDEAHYQRLLEKARKDAVKASGAQLEAYEQKIQMLESDLAKAHEKAERAQAMAERTKSGYVYIISNIGSFGSDVVKIGLTRRLDPEDRVRELGDASVPFLFDIHAIIYSDDAPALERALHSEFDSVRVNGQNYRKEFFRATIAQVESAVARLAPAAPFFRDVEAQDYRETLARRQAKLTAQPSLSAFPDAL